MAKDNKPGVSWVAVLVLALSLGAAFPIYWVLYKTALCCLEKCMTISAEGALIANAGLCAVLVCLVLRLRNYRDDLVTPPSLVGPIVIVVIGALLMLGDASFAKH